MKFLYLTISIILLSACSSYKKQGVEVKNKLVQTSDSQKGDVIIKETINVLPNSEIKYQKDATGAGFVDIVKGNKTVVRYIYDIRPKDKTLRDGNYTQEVLFQIDGKLREMEAKDEDLSKINALVGMHGFFRRAGIYPIKKGTISIKLPSKDEADIHIQIEKPNYMVNQKDIAVKLNLKQQK